MQLVAILIVVAILLMIWLSFSIVGFVLHLIPALIIGLIAGAIASRIVGSRHGIFGDIVLGIFGGILANFIFGLFFHVSTRTNFLYSIFFATLGAIIILLIGKAINRPRYTY